MLSAETDREAWLAARRTCITGRDMAALVGVDPYTTPLHVWRDKVHGAVHLDDNAAMWRGRILEPAILAEYERELGRALERPGFVRDARRPHLGGTPDGWDPLTRTVVEVKTFGMRQREKWGPDGSDDCDPLAWVQGHHYAGLLGAAHLLVLAFDVEADELRRYPIDVDTRAIAGMQDLAGRWWADHVLLEEAPGDEMTEAQWAAADEVFDALHRRDNGLAIDGDASVIDAALAYDEARAAEKAASEAKLAARARLKQLLGDAKKATFDGGRVHWDTRKDVSAVSWEAVARAAGASDELIAAHTVVKPGPRVMRVVLKGAV